MDTIETIVKFFAIVLLLAMFLAFIVLAGNGVFNANKRKKVAQNTICAYRKRIE